MFLQVIRPFLQQAMTRVIRVANKSASRQLINIADFGCSTGETAPSLFSVVNVSERARTSAEHSQDERCPQDVSELQSWDVPRTSGILRISQDNRRPQHVTVLGTSLFPSEQRYPGDVDIHMMSQSGDIQWTSECGASRGCASSQDVSNHPILVMLAFQSHPDDVWHPVTSV